MFVGERIKQRRKELGLSVDDVAIALKKDRSTIYRYESHEIEKLPTTVLEPLANVLQTTPAYLMGWEEPQNGARFPSASPNTTEDYVSFPIFEEFAKGPRCFSEEPCENQKIDIPLSYLKGRKKEDYFVLTVKGSNMYPLYHENDKVLILKQNTLKASGDIGVVCYDDIYVLLRKIEYTDGGNWLRLVSTNPNFPPETITGDYRILGIPRLIIREINY